MRRPTSLIEWVVAFIILLFLIWLAIVLVDKIAAAAVLAVLNGQA